MRIRLEKLRIADVEDDSILLDVPIGQLSDDGEVALTFVLDLLGFDDPERIEARHCLDKLAIRSYLQERIRVLS